MFSHSGGGSRRVVPSLFCFSEVAIHVAAPCCDRSVEECAAGGNVYICEHKERERVTERKKEGEKESEMGLGGGQTNQPTTTQQRDNYLGRVNIFR